MQRQINGKDFVLRRVQSRSKTYFYFVFCMFVVYFVLCVRRFSAYTSTTDMCKIKKTVDCNEQETKQKNKKRKEQHEILYLMNDLWSLPYTKQQC